jgi:hypothetical protein
VHPEVPSDELDDEAHDTPERDELHVAWQLEAELERGQAKHCKTVIEELTCDPVSVAVLTSSGWAA